MSGRVTREREPVPVRRSLPPRAGPAELETAVNFGEPAAPLPALFDLEGVRQEVPTEGHDEVVVIAFLSDACPAVKACIDSLVSLRDRFASRRVHVIGVNPNNPYLSPRDAPEEMARWARDHRLNFPYLKDREGALARRLGVCNTPQFVVLDRERRLRYRGHMFDSRDPAQATTADLEDAIDCLLREVPIRVRETRPLGCSIVW